MSPFDPAAETGFVEGNAAQYTWMAPQDPAQLIRRLGGRSIAGHRLDQFFTRLNAGPTRPYAFLGNEPTLDTPWLYDWLGEPGKASAVIHRALLGLYAPAPGGMPGNDDGGTMSAWWLLAALGIYPTSPGSDTLALNQPLFRRSELALPAGKLEIDASRGPAGATLDGKRLGQPRVTFRALARGLHRLRLSYRPAR